MGKNKSAGGTEGRGGRAPASKWLSKPPTRGPGNEPYLHIALILGYLGTPFYGLMLQKLMPRHCTVEGRLLVAAHLAGLTHIDIRKDIDSSTQIRFSRGSRTDKGVHAVRNFVTFHTIAKNLCFPFEPMMDKNAPTEHDLDEDGVVMGIRTELATNEKKRIREDDHERPQHSDARRGNAEHGSTVQSCKNPTASVRRVDYLGKTTLIILRMNAALALLESVLEPFLEQDRQQGEKRDATTGTRSDAAANIVNALTPDDIDKFVLEQSVSRGNSDLKVGLANTDAPEGSLRPSSFYTSVQPISLKVFSILPVGKHFNARRHTSRRQYHYLIPAWVLDKEVNDEGAAKIMMSHVHDNNNENIHPLAAFRMVKDNNNNSHNENGDQSSSTMRDSVATTTAAAENNIIEYYTTLSQKANALFKKFTGLHRCHNLTEDTRRSNENRFLSVKACDPEALRMIYRCGVLPTPILVHHNDAVDAANSGAGEQQLYPYFLFQIEGASFLLHMIRKIVGSVISVIRGAREGLIDDILDPTKTVVTPLAPPHGLYMHRPFLDGYDTARTINNKNESDQDDDEEGDDKDVDNDRGGEDVEDEERANIYHDGLDTVASAQRRTSSNVGAHEVSASPNGMVPTYSRTIPFNAMWDKTAYDKFFSRYFDALQLYRENHGTLRPPPEQRVPPPPLCTQTEIDLYENSSIHTEICRIDNSEQYRSAAGVSAMAKFTRYIKFHMWNVNKNPFPPKVGKKSKKLLQWKKEEEEANQKEQLKQLQETGSSDNQNVGYNPAHPNTQEVKVPSDEAEVTDYAEIAKLQNERWRQYHCDTAANTGAGVYTVSQEKKRFQVKQEEVDRKLNTGIAERHRNAAAGWVSCHEIMCLNNFRVPQNWSLACTSAALTANKPNGIVVKNIFEKLIENFESASSAATGVHNDDDDPSQDGKREGSDDDEMSQWMRCRNAGGDE